MNKQAKSHASLAAGLTREMFCRPNCSNATMSDACAWTSSNSADTGFSLSSRTRTGTVATAGPAIRSSPLTGACRPETVVPKQISSVSQYRARTIAQAVRRIVALVMEVCVERGKAMLFVIARLSFLPLSPVVDMGGNEARWASSSWVLQYALAASTSSSEVYLMKPAYGGRNWYISTLIRSEERIHNDLHTPPIEDGVVHHKHKVSISTRFLHNPIPAQSRSV